MKKICCVKLEVFDSGIGAEKIDESRHKFSSQSVGMKDPNATKGRDPID